MPTLSSTCKVRSMSVQRPTVARQFGPAWSPTLIPLPAARMSARVITTTCGSLLAAGGRAGHGPHGLGAEGQLVNRVLRLDEEGLAALVAENALDRRRHHA